MGERVVSDVARMRDSKAVDHRIVHDFLLLHPYLEVFHLQFKLLILLLKQCSIFYELSFFGSQLHTSLYYWLTCFFSFVISSVAAIFPMLLPKPFVLRVRGLW